MMIPSKFNTLLKARKLLRKERGTTGNKRD